jgi:hypothetical protein
LSSSLGILDIWDMFVTVVFDLLVIVVGVDGV